MKLHLYSALGTVTCLFLANISAIDASIAADSEYKTPKRLALATPRTRKNTPVAKAPSQSSHTQTGQTEQSLDSTVQSIAKSAEDFSKTSCRKAYELVWWVARSIGPSTRLTPTIPVPGPESFKPIPEPTTGSDAKLYLTH